MSGVAFQLASVDLALFRRDCRSRALTFDMRLCGALSCDERKHRGSSLFSDIPSAGGAGKEKDKD